MNLTIIKRYTSNVGIDIRKVILSIPRLILFSGDYRRMKREILNNTPQFAISPCYPCLWDREDNGGQANGAYFHQDLYVAQKIFNSEVKSHMDVGSRIDGFVAHVATFMPIEIIDIRQVESTAKNISFRQADMMNTEQCEANICESLSCLHALEHFGLARYGDPMNAKGHLQGFESLLKMTKIGGVLYLSVPIGPLRIEFNAHRIFSMDYLLTMFGDKVEIIDFAYVDDRGDIYCEIDPLSSDATTNFGCDYGCGIFTLRKK